jgi:hypothetical protein
MCAPGPAAGIKDDRPEPLAVVQLFLAAEIKRGDNHLLLLAA